MTEPENRPGQTGFDPFSNQRRLATLEEMVNEVSFIPDLTELWVRDDDGNDSFPGTEEFPLKTLTKVDDKIAALSGNVLVHVGDHQGSGYAPITLTPRNSRGNTMIIGDGAGVGDGFAEVQAPELADGASDATKIVKAGGGLSTDVFRAHTVIITAGTGIGQRRTIAENTSTDIKVAKDFAVVPDGTSEYRIVKNTVVINLPAETTMFSGGLAGILNFSDATANPAIVLAQVVIQNSTASQLRMSGANVVLYGVEFDASSTNNLKFDGSSINVGMDDFFSGEASIPVSFGLATSSDDWAGWGIGHLSNFGGFFLEGHYGSFNGFWVIGAMGISNLTQVTMFGGKLISSGARPALSVANRALAIIGGFGSTTILEATGSADAAQATSQGQIQSLVLELRAVNGALLRAHTAGFISFFGAFATGTSSNGRAGDASLGGKIYMTGAPLLAGTPSGTEFTIGSGGDADTDTTGFGSVGSYISHPNDSVIQRFA